MNPVVIGLLIRLGIKLIPAIVDAVKELTDDDREALAALAKENPEAAAQQVAALVAKDTGTA